VSLALGIDLVAVARIAAVLSRHPERFQKRHFTQREILHCGGDPVRLAGRWAAKEAAAKALGCGIGAVGWREIEIVADELGAPRLCMHGRAREKARAAGLAVWSVSVSHTADHAVAAVAGISSATSNAAPEVTDAPA